MSVYPVFRASALILLLQLTGCAAIVTEDKAAPVEDLRTRHEGLIPDKTQPPQPGTEGVVEVPPELRERAIARDQSAPVFMTPAVVALVRDAEQSLHSESYGTAVATYERALRLEPRNGVLWHRLASVRLKQGKPQLAAQMAAKSNSFAGKDDRLRLWNWRLIAQAREQLGDHQGAKEARQRAAELKSRSR